MNEMYGVPGTPYIFMRGLNLIKGQILESSLLQSSISEYIKRPDM